MAFVLENERIRLECREAGGEMKSLFDKEKNVEILYQGKEGWSGSNPSLFPIIGSTWTGSYTINGKEYSMKNHGLIRYAVLNADPQEDRLIFRYASDEKTKTQYPFDFEYSIAYTLENNTVRIAYEIKNTGEAEMPFSFGLHPAFRTPQNPGETFEDYEISFVPESDAVQLVFTPQLDPVKREKVHLDTWQLSREDIDRYATIVYTEYDCTEVILACRKEARIKVAFPGFPYLALWSHPSRSSFICIEPWYGHADFEKTADDFYHREGTQILEAGQTFKASYEISILN